MLEMVGREGVEPSTKRLRAAWLNRNCRQHNAFSPALSMKAPVQGQLAPTYGVQS